MPWHAMALWHAERSWSSKPGSQYAARRWERRDTLSPGSGCRTHRRQESRRQTADASTSWCTAQQPQKIALCCDATLVSPITGANAPHPRADHTPGIALRMAASRKRATYPELQRGGGQRLFVLAVEVGGRWNADSQALVRQFVWVRALRAPPPLRAAASSAWTRRWWGTLSTAVQHAVGGTALGTEWLVSKGAAGCAPWRSLSQLPLR